MSLHHLSDNLILVTVPREPLLTRKLASVNEVMAINGGDADVILDFSQVNWVSSSSLSNLILLNKWLEDNSRRLVLFGVSFETKCIIRTVGLGDMFLMGASRRAAVEMLAPMVSSDSPESDVGTDSV
jgi:anti-anti-sigma regulatory factor